MYSLASFIQLFIFCPYWLGASFLVGPAMVRSPITATLLRHRPRLPSAPVLTADTGEEDLSALGGKTGLQRVGAGGGRSTGRRRPAARRCRHWIEAAHGGGGVREVAHDGRGGCGGGRSGGAAGAAQWRRTEPLAGVKTTVAVDLGKNNDLELTAHGRDGDLILWTVCVLVLPLQVTCR